MNAAVTAGRVPIHRSLCMREILIILSACLLTACAPGTNQTELYLGTATLGGAYYPLGQGISNLVTQHAEGLTMVPIVTRGAV